MQMYDLVMLAVLAAAIGFGAWKGLAWQIASMASIFVSYLAAHQFRHVLADRISAAPPWNMFAAMLILFVVTSLLVWIAFGFIYRFIEQVKLKDFDRQIGALLGAAKGVLLCVIITLFAMTLSSDQQRQAIAHSRSGYYISKLLDQANTLMPPEVHEVLHPYLDKLDRGLRQDNVGYGRLDTSAIDEPASAATSAAATFDIERSARVLKSANELLQATR